jgi:hypothetical protein
MLFYGTTDGQNLEYLQKPYTGQIIVRWVALNGATDLQPNLAHL